MKQIIFDKTIKGFVNGSKEVTFIEGNTYFKKDLGDFLYKIWNGKGVFHPKERGIEIGKLKSYENKMMIEKIEHKKKRR